MDGIHDRMPVILDPDTFDVWLDPDNDEIPELTSLLRAAPAGTLTHHPVSRRVGNVRNNDAGLVAPVPDARRTRLDTPCSTRRTATMRTRSATRQARMKLTLDLHDIYNRGGDIDRALRAIIDEAVDKKVRMVEIIPGKGSGQLKKRVLRFLDQKEIKALYDRVEKDSHNFGRVFVHFRHK